MLLGAHIRGRPAVQPGCELCLDFSQCNRSHISQIHTGLQKAQWLLKQSKKKGYYKVLGVACDADQHTMKKA